MLLRYDHIMVAAPDLATVHTQFGELGFTVVQRPDEGAAPAVEQALVCFEDDSYLEIVLLGSGDAAAHAHRYWDLFSAGAALVDYSMATEDIESDIARARDNGATTEPVRSLRRKRLADGAEWEIAFSTLGLSVGPASLPFLIENRTDPSVRAPGGAAREHANGSSGICGVTVVVDEPESAAREVERALRLSFTSAVGDRYGAYALARFGDGRWLALVAANQAGEHRQRYVRHGPGPVEIAIRTPRATVEPGEGAPLPGWGNWIRVPTD